ncbi:MAG TPA: STAS/SEC14 domain-containing protein [Spirillospora sp.]|nr:STAS/SEC14 domain-containing protein [Spirillospora sp.]
MSVEIYPAEAAGAVAVECRDVMTVEDARYLLERCLAAVRSRPVHFLIDCTDLQTLAPGVLHVLAGSGDFVQHPNTRWLAFVTRSALLKRSLELLLGPADLRFFDDREAASRFLHAVSD